MLKKILRLAKKTGDKIILFDSNEPESAYVLIGLEEYEQNFDVHSVNSAKVEPIKDLTGDELTDKINRDISLWKNRESFFSQEQEKNESPLMPIIEKDFNVVPLDSNREDMVGKNVDKENIEERKQEKKPRWQIPSVVKEKAQKVIDEE
jgi:nicotinamide mononucleotide adenylyltransferase